MWKRHFTDLPIELEELILQHVYAQKIQTQFRRHMFKFTKNDVWKTKLRTALMNAIATNVISLNQFQLLCKNAIVRREWQCEPESWLHIFQHDDVSTCISTITDEIQSGLWTMYGAHTCVS